MEPEYHEVYEEDALQDLANGKPGAEFHLLEILRCGVQCGFPMAADFQKAANLIIAKSMLLRKLPAPKKGRPISKPGKVGLKITTQYLTMMDEGQGYQKSVDELADTFHKNGRQIMRIVKENRHAVKVQNAYLETWKVMGASPAQIDKLWTSMTGIGGNPIDPAIQTQELLTDIERRLNKILQSRRTTDTNSRHFTPVT